MEFEITIEPLPQPESKFMCLSGRYRATISNPQIVVNDNYLPTGHWVWSTKLMAKSECRKRVRYYQRGQGKKHTFTYKV